jgi:hypothetical protein
MVTRLKVHKSHILHATKMNLLHHAVLWQTFSACVNLIQNTDIFPPSCSLFAQLQHFACFAVGCCSTLQHLPASLLELYHDWEMLWESAIATLDLQHLTALTKLATGGAEQLAGD